MTFYDTAFGRFYELRQPSCYDTTRIRYFESVLKRSLLNHVVIVAGDCLQDNYTTTSINLSVSLTARKIVNIDRVVLRELWKTASWILSFAKSRNTRIE